MVLHSQAFDTESSRPIVRSLALVPGMKIWHDGGGAIAQRFRVLTSGHVLLYEPGGRLLYSGGITAARGHRGDNFGRSAIVAAILERPRDHGSMPVFGCPLFESQRALTVEARP